MTADNKAIYDEHWESWQRIKEIGPMSRHSRRLVFNEAARGPFSTVLDVGCGPGVFLAALKRRFPGVAVWGADVSQTAVDLAARNVPGGTFFTADVSREPPVGRFDLVTMIDVAEHIPDDTAAFRNLLPCCAGRLLVATLEGRMRPFEPEVGHVRNYAPGELAGKLAAAGFTVERVVHWGWPMFSPLYRNISGTVAAHEKNLGPAHRIMASIVYVALGMNVPGKGDLIIAVARPA